jgi:DNA-binding transcriptional regulator LsrR (DeoR family)
VTADHDVLVQASRLYYELGETQNAIADRLGVTRPQVSRLLKRARAEGIVEIRIVDRDTAESPAAADLVARFGLDAVHLAPTLTGPEDLTRRIVGRLAAQVLRASVRDGAIVGIGDGASVAAVADALADAATPVRATVVPLAGGYWSTGADRDPYRRIADAFGAQPHGLMAPGLLDDAATKRALEAHAGVRAVLDL